MGPQNSGTPARSAAYGGIRKVWDFVTGTWPGRIAALVAFVPTAWGAWEIFEAAFVPAHVSGQLECHPNLLVIHATNSGGRTATLGDATFKMKSLGRFQNREWHYRRLSALANPLEKQGARELAPHQPRPIPFRSGGPIYYDDEIKGSDCQFRVTLPYTSNRGPSIAEIEDCTCAP